jgi:hypothetical protein
MGVTGASLTLAAFLSLLSGQGAGDGRRYAAYEAQLARILASESASRAPVVASTPPAAQAAATAGCILSPGSGNSATTQDCTACHRGFERGHSHPVDVPQEGRRSRSLRSAAEVVKRGVFLADGKVTCLSCHDGNSPYKAKLALPPDAPLREPVKPGRPETYAPGFVAASALSGLTATSGRTALPPGTAVSPTPLCKACHAFD